MIKAKNVKFDYIRRDEDENVVAIETAIDDISFDVKKGDFIAILGHNGSGKSTLAKHLNALLIPEEGSIYVNDIDTKDEDMLWEIRQTTGMVFQNPDNQIVYNTVEEDVAFGLENLNVPEKEIKSKVKSALESVGMFKWRKKSPNTFSGGQKQRIAIAGVLAMNPSCIVFDEATALLDPIGRKDVLETVMKLNKEKNITIIWITHNMDEVIKADKVFVMNKGKIVMEGRPKEVFSRVEELIDYQLEVPQVTMLAYELKKRGLPIEEGILSPEELADNIALFV